MPSSMVPHRRSHLDTIPDLPVPIYQVTQRMVTVLAGPKPCVPPIRPSPTHPLHQRTHRRSRTRPNLHLLGITHTGSRMGQSAPRTRSALSTSLPLRGFRTHWVLRGRYYRPHMASLGQIRDLTRSGSLASPTRTWGQRLSMLNPRRGHLPKDAPATQPAWRCPRRSWLIPNRVPRQLRRNLQRRGCLPYHSP